jgi:hypothetical protein
VLHEVPFAVIKVSKELQKHDLVVVHIEAPDEAGHDGSIEHKIRAIEKIDREVISRFRSWKAGSLRLLVMPDHPTPIKIRTHCDDPVPFLLWGAGFTPSGAAAFTEAEAKRTGVFLDEGYKIMDRFINVILIHNGMSNNNSQKTRSQEEIILDVPEIIEEEEGKEDIPDISEIIEEIEKEKIQEQPKTNLELEAELLKMLDERKKILDEIKKLESTDSEDLIEISDYKSTTSDKEPNLFGEDILDKPKQNIFVDENGKIFENLLQSFDNQEDITEEIKKRTAYSKPSEERYAKKKIIIDSIFFGCTDLAYFLLNKKNVIFSLITFLL